MNTEPINDIVANKVKIGSYVYVSKEYLREVPDARSEIYDQLIITLHGYVYEAAKEQGHLTTTVMAPSFFDWLFRRTKTVSIPYELSHLVKLDLIIGKENSIPIIRQCHKTVEGYKP
jgi:hypothetical protein